MFSTLARILKCIYKQIFYYREIYSSLSLFFLNMKFYFKLEKTKTKPMSNEQNSQEPIKLIDAQSPAEEPKKSPIEAPQPSPRKTAPSPPPQIVETTQTAVLTIIRNMNKPSVAGKAEENVVKPSTSSSRIETNENSVLTTYSSLPYRSTISPRHTVISRRAVDRAQPAVSYQTANYSSSISSNAISMRPNAIQNGIK